MHIIEHQFLPNDDVYVLTECDGAHTVVSARIIRVQIDVVATTATILYSASTRLSTSKKYDEEVVFETKELALSALSNLID